MEWIFTGRVSLALSYTRILRTSEWGYSGDSISTVICSVLQIINVQRIDISQVLPPISYKSYLVCHTYSGGKHSMLEYFLALRFTFSFRDFFLKTLHFKYVTVILQKVQNIFEHANILFTPHNLFGPSTF